MPDSISIVCWLVFARLLVSNDEIGAERSDDPALSADKENQAAEHQTSCASIFAVARQSSQHHRIMHEALDQTKAWQDQQIWLKPMNADVQHYPRRI